TLLSSQETDTHEPTPKNFLQAPTRGDLTIVEHSHQQIKSGEPSLSGSILRLYALGTQPLIQALC
ncbi:hypothetical protein, partial [Propionibacterium freudenreichii]